MSRTGHYRWRILRTQYKTQCKARNNPCWICHQPINYQASPNTTNSFEPDHYHPVKTHPHLEYDIANLRPSHSGCNRARQDDAAPNLTEQWVKADW